MPYQTPYPTSLPGLDEARLLAIQAMIISSLADLNAALNRDSASPLSLSSAQVVLGDVDQVTSSLICVCGGGEQDGTDLDATGYLIPRYDKGGHRVSLHTNIYVYIGPDDLRTDDKILYNRYREMTIARIADHLRKRVFNSLQGTVIQLQSQELTTGQNFDQLLDCHVECIKKGRVPKGPGAAYSVWCAHLQHVGWIA